MLLVFSLLALTLAAAAQPGTDANQKLGKIDGKVVHAVTGVPLPRVQLTASVAGSEPAAATTTAADGSFTLPGLPAGNYLLSANRTGFLDAAYSGRGTTPGSVFSIQLAAGQALTGITFKLTPQSVLVVKVLDQNGEPVESSGVQILRTRFTAGRRQLTMVIGGPTNDLGEFRFSNQSAGTYFISAGPPGGSVRLHLPPRKPGQTVDEVPATTYYPNALNVANAAPVPLAIGQELQLTVHLQTGRAYRIRGAVPTGTPAGSSLTLTAHADRNTVFIGRSSVTVRPDGSFEMAAVAPGSYVAELYRRDNPYTSPAARAFIEVTNADVDGLALTPLQTVSLKGRIIVEGNGAEASSTNKAVDLTALRVQLLPLDDPTAPRTADSSGFVAADGTWTLNNVVQGRFQPEVQGNLGGAYLKSIRFGDLDITKSSLDLNGITSPPPLEMVYSLKPANIEIHVVREPADRAPGFVLIVPDPLEFAESPYISIGYSVLRVSQAGTASRTMPPGKYRLYALETYDANEGLDPALFKRLESKSEVLTVGEGEKASVNLKQILAADLESR